MSLRVRRLLVSYVFERKPDVSQELSNREQPYNELSIVVAYDRPEIQYFLALLL